MSTYDTIGSQETTKLLSTDGGVADAPVAANDAVVGVNEEQPDLYVEEEESCNCEECCAEREAAASADDPIRATVLANLPDTNLARFCLQRHADEARQ